MPAMSELLTLPEVAAVLKFSNVAVGKWCREGKLPAVKVGKSYRIRRADLDAWYEALRGKVAQS